MSEAVLALTGYTAEQFLRDDVLFDKLILAGHRERTDRELEDALGAQGCVATGRGPQLLFGEPRSWRFKGP